MESEKKFERIGGTATGGGTFWGLGSLLTKAKVLFVRQLVVFLLYFVLNIKNNESLRKID